jgi:tetrahydromethanopterin S-methyltransferase subunit A
MNPTQAIELAWAELQSGMALSKCQQCGCMRETLETLLHASIAGDGSPTRELARQAATWLENMASIHYACLGCAHCYPALALNALEDTSLINGAGPSCAFAATDKNWPVVAGQYAVLCNRSDCPVAVSTLASTQLVDDLARLQPTGLCIVGKTETENIGVDKVVKNIVANPTIRYLIVAGRDPDGHRSGQTLLALANNGVDERMRVLGSMGKRPILRNVTRDEVVAFRKQVQVVDLIGCEDTDKLVATIKKLSAVDAPSQAQACACSAACSTAVQPVALTPDVVEARPAERIEMDRAGYFVIIPDPERRVITLEHYAYDNQLQHVVEGASSRELASTIISAGWVSQLSHAAYLGRELAKAELSLQQGRDYVQDSD